MREERHAERIDEVVNDGKLTWEKPALKVFPIDDTAGGGAPGNDGVGLSFESD